MSIDKAIGLVGTNGSGKSTVCDYLMDQGFKVYSLSNIIREAVEEKKLPLDRDHLTEMGNQLKADYGQAVLAEQSFENAVESNCSCVVFDSVRNMLELSFLREKGVKFIGVDASLELRYKRIKSRMKETDQVSFEEFVHQDDRENTGKSSGQHILKTLSACDVVIKNETSVIDLYSNIDAVLQTFWVISVEADNA